MKAIPRRSRVGMALVVVTALVLIYMQQAALAAVVVTPSSNLPASANVNVSGNGFTANQPGTISECKFNPGLGADECKAIGSFTTNASGNFGPVAVTVTSTYVSSDNTNVNCAVDAAANPCRVQATLNNVFGQQEAPISFAGSTTTSSSTSTSTIPTTTSSSTSTSTIPTTTSSSTSTSTIPTTTSSSTSTS
ncbi:MAG: Neocarzinostatin family, partial [Actinomycetota bacterium]|nr:Neocarzinostatin family [Actinomycetota bacterium]